MLEKEQQVKQVKSNSYTVIRLLNYKEYQKKEQQKDKSETTERQQKDTNKNDKNVKNDKKKARFTPPDSLLEIPEFENTWIDFEEHRKAIGKKMTEVAATRIFNKVQKLNGSPVDILNQSIENGWTGVFELKDGGGSSDEFDPEKARKYQQQMAKAWSE